MQLALDTFETFLNRQGLKLTRDRREILESICASKGHFNIDDLFIRMRVAGSRIAKTTIYRAIPLLIGCNIIQKVPSNTKHECYEQVRREDHDHLVCLNCGKMVEFSSKSFEKAQTDACRRHGFEPLFHRVHIHGYCRECQKERPGV